MPVVAITNKGSSEAATSEGSSFRDTHQPTLLLGVFILLDITWLRQNKQYILKRRTFENPALSISLYVDYNVCWYLLPELPGRTDWIPSPLKCQMNSSLVPSVNHKVYIRLIRNCFFRYYLPVNFDPSNGKRASSELLCFGLRLSIVDCFSFVVKLIYRAIMNTSALICADCSSPSKHTLRISVAWSVACRGR